MRKQIYFHSSSLTILDVSPYFIQCFPGLSGQFHLTIRVGWKTGKGSTNLMGFIAALGTTKTFELKYQPWGLLQLSCGPTRSVAYSWAPQQGLSPELQESKELIFYNLCIPYFWPTEPGSLPTDHLHKPERAPGAAAPTPVFLVLHRPHPVKESLDQTDITKVWQTQMGISFMVKTGRFDKLAVQKAQNYTLLSHCTFQGCTFQEAISRSETSYSKTNLPKL